MFTECDRVPGARIRAWEVIFTCSTGIYFTRPCLTPPGTRDPAGSSSSVPETRTASCRRGWAGWGGVVVHRVRVFTATAEGEGGAGVFLAQSDGGGQGRGVQDRQDQVLSADYRWG